MAHALEQFLRWQPPNKIAHLVSTQKAFLDQKDETEHESEGEGGVSQNAERDMEREDGPVRWRWSELIRRRGVSGQKKHEHEWQSVSAHGALAMIDLQSEIGQAEKPAKERHRTIKIVVRNGVLGAGAFEESQVVGDQ